MKKRNLAPIAGATHKPYLTNITSPTTEDEENSTTTQDLGRLTSIRKRRSVGINKRTRKLKATAKKPIEKKLVSNQRFISNYINCKPPGDQGSGHSIEDKVHKGDIRVYLQNPNGAKSKGAYYDDTVALKQLKNSRLILLHYRKQIITGNINGLGPNGVTKSREYGSIPRSATLASAQPTRPKPTIEEESV